MVYRDFAHLNTGDPLIEKALLADWTAYGEPTYAQCREAALGGREDIRSVRVGVVLCVWTSDGRIAMMVTKKVDGHQDTITFAVTVWE